MTDDSPSLTASSEVVLLELANQQRRDPTSGLVGIELLAARAEMPEAECWDAVLDLQRHGLAEAVVGGSRVSRAAAVTEAGHQAAFDLGIVPAKGAVPEFAQGLERVERAILDAVAMHELRIPGGAATRSHVRTHVRNVCTPRPEIDQVNRAIEGLITGHLQVVSGSEPCYRVQLRGLLASDWGTNVISILDGTIRFLREQKTKDPSLFRYSWGTLRKALAVSRNSLNLVYVSIMNAKLGNGLFETEGDSWWATLPDLDVVLENAPAVSHVRGLTAPQATISPVEDAQPPVASSPSTASPMKLPRLLRVRIEGFRRIQKPVEFDFRTPAGKPMPLVVFAGPNGSGKTSVLEAILLGLGRDDLISRDMPTEVTAEERTGHWRLSVPPGGRIEIHASFDDGPETAWVRTSEDFAGTPIRSPLYAPRIVPFKNTEVEYFSSWRAPRLVGPVKPLRRGPKSADNEANRLLRFKQRLSDERARRGYEPAQPRVKIDTWLNRLNEAWRKFHPKDGTSLDVQLVDPTAEDIWADVFVLRNGSRVCTIDQLSSGEIELVAFASFLILNDFRSGLLVIDEPELHLHPQWQAAILPALQTLAPDAQLIVASHADAPWDQAFSFERFLLPPSDLVDASLSKGTI